MKAISTELKTGLNIVYEGRTAIVGTYKKPNINIHLQVSKTAQITIQLTTKKVNQLIKLGKIKFQPL